MTKYVEQAVTGQPTSSGIPTCGSSGSNNPLNHQPPWIRVLPEKQTSPQISKKFPTFYGTQRRTEGGGVQTPPPKFRNFDKVEPDCKFSGKCLVFLFQRLN